MNAEQNRLEFKFLLPAGAVHEVRSRIMEGLGDEMEANDHYCICSDYFDTEDRTSYWEKLLAFPNRRRLRLRRYSDSQVGRAPACFYEIKHKVDDLAVKRRVLATEAELNATLCGDWPDFAGKGSAWMARELEGMMKPYPWEPLVRIRYERDEYDTGPEGTLRLTVDSKVRCCYPDYATDLEAEPDIELLGEDEAIMEVKTIGPVPYWFRNMLGRFGLVPQGLSKYTKAIDYLDGSALASQPMKVKYPTGARFEQVGQNA